MATTPYSTVLEEGTYTITMPAQVVAGPQTYNFVRWNDGDTNTVKTITLTSDASLTAEYALAPLPTHTLTVNSTPIQGIPFAIERVS